MSDMNPPAFQSHDIRSHVIEARALKQTFTVKVLEPMSRTDGSERFPVLYATDSDYFFGGLANLTTMLQGYGEVPRFILVGIGYANAQAAGVLRMRHLLPRKVQEQLRAVIHETAKSDFVTDVADVAAVLKGGDAGDFLKFLRAELIPFIDASYPTMPRDNSFFGYSAGASFGFYTLFTQPDTFKRYVLGSAGACYAGRNFAIAMARDYLNSHRSLKAQLFVSVGEQEELQRGAGEFEFVVGHYQLIKYLQKAGIDGLELVARVFPGETHASAWTLAFSHGLRAVFGAAEHVPFWPELRGDT